VREDHLKDASLHIQLQTYCLENGFLFAHEVTRLRSINYSNRYACDIDDLVCKVHSFFSDLLLSYIIRGYLNKYWDSNSIENLKIISTNFDVMTFERTIVPANEFYSSQYQSNDVIYELRDKLKNS
jgi:hypothetical protein